MAKHIDTCPVCKKQYENYDASYRRWCSVGCEAEAASGATISDIHNECREREIDLRNKADEKGARLAKAVNALVEAGVLSLYEEFPDYGDAVRRLKASADAERQRADAAERDLDLAKSAYEAQLGNTRHYRTVAERAEANLKLQEGLASEHKMRADAAERERDEARAELEKERRESRERYQRRRQRQHQEDYAADHRDRRIAELEAALCRAKDELVTEGVCEDGDSVPWIDAALAAPAIPATATKVLPLLATPPRSAIDAILPRCEWRDAIGDRCRWEAGHAEAHEINIGEPSDNLDSHISTKGTK